MRTRSEHRPGWRGAGGARKLFARMRNLRRGEKPPISASLLLAVLILAVYPKSAFAYIDPGSGSLLLQIVMSAFFGALFLARNFLAKATGGFRRLFSGGKEEPPPPPEKPGA